MKFCFFFLYFPCLETMNPDDGFSPLRFAIIERRTSDVASMVQSGTFDVNKYLYPSEHEITTPLVLASKVGLIDTVRVILDAGARLNTQDGAVKQRALPRFARWPPT
jgi:hypothetical protein